MQLLHSTINTPSDPALLSRAEIIAFIDEILSNACVCVCVFGGYTAPPDFRWTSRFLLQANVGKGKWP